MHVWHALGELLLYQCYTTGNIQCHVMSTEIKTGNEVKELARIYWNLTKHGIFGQYIQDLAGMTQEVSLFPKRQWNCEEDVMCTDLRYGVQRGYN